MQLQTQDQDLKLDKNCIFCKIIRGEIPCSKIYEDDSVLAFLDIAPANKGHCLVLPKNHYETFLDCPEEELEDVLKIAKRIVRAMSSALGNQGFNILLNNKKEAGQLVPHVHCHIIPRYVNDGIKLNWQPKRYKDKEIDKFAEKIKSFL